MRPEALKDWGEYFHLAASRVSRTLCLGPAPVGAGPVLSLVASDLCFFSGALCVVVFLVCNRVLIVSCCVTGCGQITVWFRDAVVVESGGFFYGCRESLAPGAPFSFSLAPLRGCSCASTQRRGALLSIIPSQHRSLRTGLEPGRCNHGKF